MTKFAIFCFPRTGSYLFADLLDAQKDVVCHGEIFKEESVELRPEYRQKLNLKADDTAKRAADPVGFYKSVYALTPGSTTGFKIFPNHEEVALRGLLLDKSIRKIFLGRNPVQSFISLKVAQKTGTWINRGERDQKPAKVRIGHQDLIMHICRQKQFYDRCRITCASTQSPFLLVDYSDLSSPQALDRVARFLGLKEWDATVQTKLRKQINTEYPSIVENWPAVERLMRQSGTAIDQPFLEFARTFINSSFQRGSSGADVKRQGASGAAAISLHPGPVLQPLGRSSASAAAAASDGKEVNVGTAESDTAARGVVLLCRRRTGGRALMKVLSGLSDVAVLPDQPFLWQNPLGAISREFYTGDRRSAVAELNAAMARPASFVHVYEVDGRGFNEALLDALAANDRKVVLFDRADEVARAFSRVVTGHFGLKSRQAVAEFRRRLDPAAPIPAEIFTKLEQQVLWDLDYERWMEKELAKRNITVCTSSTEKMFSGGQDGLEEFNRIAAFAGLTNARARFGERVLLDRLARGAHQTQALSDLSPAFAALRQRIADIIAKKENLVTA